MYDSWPLGGASPADADGPWAWALPDAAVTSATADAAAADGGAASSFVSPSGTIACGAITGGVVDVTGALLGPTDGGGGGATGYYAVRGNGAANPGQMADYAPDALTATRYAAVAPGVNG